MTEKSVYLASCSELRAGLVIWDSETIVDEVYPAVDAGSLSRPINFDTHLDGRYTVDRCLFSACRDKLFVLLVDMFFPLVIM